MKEFDNIVSFLGLTDRKLIQEFEASLIQRKYKCGEKMFDIGEVVPYTYFVTSGIIRGYVMSQDGELVTNCFGFGSCAIANSQPFDFVSPSYIGCEFLTDGNCFILPAGRYKVITSDYPDMAVKTTEFLVKSIDEQTLHKNIIQNCNAEQRYLWFLEHYEGLIDKIPHHYIASYLGMTTITLSRIRSKLHKKTDE